MEMPAFLPAHLTYCQTCQTDQELIKALIQHPADVSLFFQIACEDDFWSHQHRKTMRALLRWSAKAYYLGQLPDFHAQKIVNLVQYYSWLHAFLFFRSSLFFTATLIIEQKEVLVNSLMFGVLSPYFQQVFRAYCFDQLRNEWTLPSISLFLFQLVHIHVLQGEIPDLWRYSYQEVWTLMRQAKAWELPSLIKECTSVLHRYLNQNNIIEILIQAQQQLLTEWKQECTDFFNQQEWGLRFLPGREADLRIELLNYYQETLELFEKFAPLITHLTFSNHLSEDSFFASIIHKTPKLKGIDLSGSSHYANQFDYLPKSLTELNLSACSWLNAQIIALISKQSPQLRELHLGSNPQLNYTSWAELKCFPFLQVLDLTRCHQITNEDLRFIAQTSSKLNDINLEECRGIGDRGVGDLIHLCPRLTHLNLNRCHQLTDRALIEIAIYGYNVVYLSLVRDSEFSDKGLLNLVQQRASLRNLNIRDCGFSIQTTNFIKEHYPLLHVED